MSRSAEVTRRRILDAAYTQFRRKGFNRIGVEEIASAAKVTKRTLYHHFGSKDALIAAMLEAQHERAFAAFRDYADRLSGSPEQIVEGFFAQLDTWSKTPRWAGSGYTRLAMELADLPGHPARAVARRHKAMLEAYFAELLARANVEAAQDRAREVFLLCEGAMALILIHGDRRYATAAAEAAKALIRRSTVRTLNPP